MAHLMANVLVIPIGRPTFDLELGSAQVAAATSVLEPLGVQPADVPAIVTDIDDAGHALVVSVTQSRLGAGRPSAVGEEHVDLVVIEREAGSIEQVRRCVVEHRASAIGRHQDRRARCCRRRDATHEVGVDPLVRQTLQHGAPGGVISDTAGQDARATQPGHRDRGVGGNPTADCLVPVGGMFVSDCERRRQMADHRTDAKRSRTGPIRHGI
jgi:hypothetical protein